MVMQTIPLMKVAEYILVDHAGFMLLMMVNFSQWMKMPLLVLVCFSADMP